VHSDCSCESVASEKVFPGLAGDACGIDRHTRQCSTLLHLMCAIRVGVRSALSSNWPDRGVMPCGTRRSGESHTGLIQPTGLLWRESGLSLAYACLPASTRRNLGTVCALRCSTHRSSCRPHPRSVCSAHSRRHLASHHRRRGPNRIGDLRCLSLTSPSIGVATFAPTRYLRQMQTRHEGLPMRSTIT